MATLITKNSQTASAVPSAGSLSTGELAVNTADAKVFTKHSDGSVKEITPSTVADGGITANKLASNAVTTAKIADANVTGAKLENSGVTAGTYTSATVTVDAKGRVTSASSGSSGGVTSLNGQTGAITNTSIDSIGSEICAVHAVTSGWPGSGTVAITCNTGDTVAGSALRYNYTINNNSGYAESPFPSTSNQSVGSYSKGGTALSGTYRCISRLVGYYGADACGAQIRYVAGFFVRVS